MGEITQKDMQEVEAGMCRSAGHCGVMGTASTMACMVESLGLSLPGNAAIPAVDSNRRVLAHHSGMRIVEMVKENLTLSKILTREAFENAIIVNTAVGGSTNFVLHLLAIAGRIGVDLSLDDMNNLAKDIPLLLNLQPSGEYFMEDFYYAGGLPAVLKELDKHLRGNVITVNGSGIKENVASSKTYDSRVISPLENPVNPISGVAVLKGNLCPDGAVLKLSAASPELMKHKGQAIVFEDIDDYKNRINDPELPATADSILVLKQVGPVGYPGMPEVGNLGLPPKLLLEGVRDMVRISDGRMSGTGFGTCILHVSPESAVGGPLAIVRDGDWIELDVPARSLNLLLSQEEINDRLAKVPQFNGIVDRGYVRLHQKHVEQAHLGADLDFLKGGSGSKVTRDSH
jgi:dihydroxy-acid dehydratase